MYSWGPLCPTDMCPSAKTEVASSDFAALEWPLKRKSGKWHKSIPRAASTPTAPFPVVACRKCCIARALLREARDYTDQPHLKRTNSPALPVEDRRSHHLQLVLGFHQESERSKQASSGPSCLFDQKKSLTEIFCWTYDGRLFDDWARFSNTHL